MALSKSKVVKVNEYFVEPVRSHKVPSQMKELHSWITGNGSTQQL